MTILEKIYNKFFDHAYFSQKISYAQSGEDLILDYLLGVVLGIKYPTYLDIGAHHPHSLSNTYLFYKRGCKGVNIEPDRSLFEHIRKMRPADINLNVGVGFNELSETADFYVMSSRALNTFSKAEAERLATLDGISIETIEKIELVPLNPILQKYFGGKGPDLLSIDVEGLDYEVLKSIRFSEFSPAVICVETCEYNPNGKLTKRRDTIDLLEEQNYQLYADTCINSIFVRRELV
jgi:FkbM family methyltransferase